MGLHNPHNRTHLLYTVNNYDDMVPKEQGDTGPPRHHAMVQKLFPHTHGHYYAL